MRKPAFVVDASVAVAWLFAGQATPETDALLARMQAGDVPAAPLLLYWEVGNVLATRTRRDVLAERDARALWKAFSDLEITLDKNDYADAAMGLALRHRITVYDAVYLACAQALALPLMSRDQGLLRAGREIG
jgi:predicted nucleic acid-binding protein